MQTGRQLRRLFVTILHDCAPASPEILWNTFKENICDDLHYALEKLPGNMNITINVETVYDYGLYLIDMALQKFGSGLLQFPSMLMWTQEWDVRLRNHLLLAHSNYDPEEEQQRYMNNFSTMNDEQKLAFESVMDSVTNKKGKLFFVSGPAGTGKTFCYNTLCHALRGQQKIVLCVASSGIAATLLKGGRTAHSMFKIPLNVKEQEFCPISRQPQLAELITKTDLII